MENEQIAATLAEHKTRLDIVEERTLKTEELTLSVQKLAMSIEVMTKQQVEDRARQDELLKSLSILSDRVDVVEQLPFNTAAQKHEDAIKQVVSLLVGLASGVLLAVAKSYIGV